MDNLNESPMGFTHSSMEHLGFSESDPSVTAFLSDGLSTVEAQQEEVEVSSSSHVEGIITSALGLADDQTCLGANLQIRLDDLPQIANTTGIIFDPPSSFPSLTTTASSIMEDNSFTADQSQCMMSDDSFEAVITSSGQTINSSLADMTLALHNYAEPMNSSGKTEVQGKAREILADSVLPTRLDIKPALPNTKPDMLLFHDKTTGKNILIPLSALQDAFQTESASNPSSVIPFEEPTSSIVSVNVSDFLNVNISDGLEKPITQAATVSSCQQSAGISMAMSGPVENIAQPYSIQSVLATTCEQSFAISSVTNSCPGMTTIGQQLTPEHTQADNMTLGLDNTNLLLSQAITPITETSLEGSKTQSFSLGSSTTQFSQANLSPVEENQTVLPTLDEKTSLISNKVNKKSVKAISRKTTVIKQQGSCRSITNKPGIVMSGNSPSRVTGKRIRKPTAKAEQYKNAKSAKEKKSPAKTTHKEISVENSSPNNPCETPSYTSKVAASNVAHMLNTVGQGAFTHKLDVSVHVDESQCVIVDGHKRWKCLLCPKEYSSKHNLVTHILDHSGIKPHCCMICGKHFKQASHLQTHMLIHGNVRPHSCTLCKRSFSQASHVKRHMAVHMERRPHICSICGRGFTFPSELKAHVEKHTNGMENVCDECDTAFDSVKKLKAHKASEHAAADLTCKDCGKQYTYPSQLRDHMMKHEGKRPYICGECGMDFMKEHHLKAHQFTHTGLKPFVCPDCGRGFNQKANLQRHLMIHEPEKQFRCDICDRSFTQPQVLKSHLLTHKDKKPHQCKVCGKQFSRLHNLNGHMHMHNGAKPHACHICGASFTLKGNLNRHKKDKHDIDGDTECTEEEAAMILNEMSGKKMADSDAQEASDDIPTPKKKRKSVPRKTVTEHEGNEEDKEIEEVWQKGLEGSSAGEEGDTNISSTELKIRSVPAKPAKKNGRKKQNSQEAPNLMSDSTQEVEANAVRTQNVDGSTEWIAYIPLSEEGLQPGTTHEVSIKLVPSTLDEPAVAAKAKRREKVTKRNCLKKGQNVSAPPATQVSTRGRKRKPVNYGDDFISNINQVGLMKNKDTSKTETAKRESRPVDHSLPVGMNIVNCNLDTHADFDESVLDSELTEPLKQLQDTSRANKQANLASLLETKLVQSLI